MLLRRKLKWIHRFMDEDRTPVMVRPSETAGDRPALRYLFRAAGAELRAGRRASAVALLGYWEELARGDSWRTDTTQR